MTQLETLPFNERQVYVTYKDDTNLLVDFYHLAFTTYQGMLNHELNDHNTPKSAKWIKYKNRSELIPISLDKKDKESLIETAKNVGGAGIAEAIFFQSIGALTGYEWTKMCKENGIKIPEEVKQFN